ncbi:hypothetical protein DRO55_06590 [Candidatus Bathyarchaeota archaeon]|nr:MAG: hypothetical protein DRO55_06590 [Candidatus Bathyarchaeota archaeon]
MGKRTTHQILTAETQLSSNYATFMMIGKDVKRGYKRSINCMGPIQLLDTAQRSLIYRGSTRRPKMLR